MEIGVMQGRLLPKYQGPFIMQAYRNDEGVKVFKEQLAWIREHMESWYAC